MLNAAIIAAATALSLGEEGCEWWFAAPPTGGTNTMNVGIDVRGATDSAWIYFNPPGNIVSYTCLLTGDPGCFIVVVNNALLVWIVNAADCEWITPDTYIVAQVTTDACGDWEGASGANLVIWNQCFEHSPYCVGDVVNNCEQ